MEEGCLILYQMFSGFKPNHADLRRGATNKPPRKTPTSLLFHDLHCGASYLKTNGWKETPLMLGNGAAMGKTLGIFRHSFSLLTRRNFSASTIPSSTGGGAAVSALQKPKRKKKKNLFEVAQFLPNWGVGYQMAKTHWSGRHVVVAPKKISGVHKRGWKYIPNSKVKEENIVKSAEVQTT